MIFGDVKHIHILGICGTFMGSLALLARECGEKVSGCDEGVYPPMSTQLEEQGIDLHTGFGSEQLDFGADLYVIGNAISRSNPLLEEILNQGLPYISGPALLADLVLPGKWVLAVAGTHGKTTTSSMLAWILEYAGMEPGFLIGGIPGNFPCSARLGKTPFFVIEADEYDSAFFDKRSKFVHYRPRTFIFNNLEFDHADIFDDLAAIQKQFHHVIRTIPQNGRVIYPHGVDEIEAVMEQGCWSEKQSYVQAQSASSAMPFWRLLNEDGSAFVIQVDGHEATVEWSLTGEHNVTNAMSALLAARHVGVEISIGAQALSRFNGVKRRMECLARIGDTTVYDDFAHHPTAIKTTLEGLRKRVGSAKIVAVIEPRSNTMKMGVHQDNLIDSAAQADVVLWSGNSETQWLARRVDAAGSKHCLLDSTASLVSKCLEQVGGETHIVIMSNGGFDGIHTKLLDQLKNEA